MPKFKRAFALLLSLLVILSAVLTSCKEKKDESNTDSNISSNVDDSDTLPVKNENIIIAENGTVNYRIVYARYITNEVKDSAFNLYETILSCSGASSFEFVRAESKPNNDANVKEILIGDTQYSASNEVMNTLGYGEWTVRVVGNKLIITSFDMDSLNNAIVEAMSIVKRATDDNGTIKIDGDFNLTQTHDEEANAIPRFMNGSYPVIDDEGDDTRLARLLDVSVEKYEEYIALLADTGYTLHSTNTIGNNRFAAYTNGEHDVNVGYYGYERTIRVTAGKGEQLPINENENVWVKNDSVVTSLASIGLGEKRGSTMSYCYQLADGSFLVIDGGYKNGATILYNYMKAKAPDGKITIAAWIITHFDPDHRQAFVEFANLYSKTVTVERLLINVPSEETSSALGATFPRDVQAAVKYMSGCKLHKVHTGQKFYIRNAVVEMLYTVDSSLPNKMFVYNDTSLVFTVDVEGERTLFTGDAGDEVAAILVDMYGSYLSSDILQLSHHGLRNGHGVKMPNMIELYELVRPEVVLWPHVHTGYLDQESDENKQIALLEWNNVALESARECYFMGGVITVLELPYSFYSAYIFDPDIAREPVCKDKSSTTGKLEYDNSVSEDAFLHVDWNSAS